MNLVVTFTPETGEVGLQAPPDRMLAYAMLEAAREILVAQGVRRMLEGERRVIPVHGTLESAVAG